ncbi:BN159_2729 family protein [Streptomyces fagopyri]|uniref:BN159_2729 family protein n=1 Tax=Streptomyces fagopyri TaxID=2662397 RepID=UPI0036B52D5A
MTTSPDNHTDIEQELAERLGRLAHTFIAELDAQGRLVETGGAQTLQSLRQQHQRHPAFVRASTAQPSPSFPPTPDQALTGLLEEQPRPPAPRRAPTDAADTPATGAAWIDRSPAPVLRGTRVLPRAGRLMSVTTGTASPRDASDGTPQPSPDEQPSTDSRNGTSSATAPHEHADRWENAHRTAATADRLKAANAHRLELTHVASDDERVTIHIRAITLHDWEYWLTTIGVPLDASTQRSGQAQIAIGRIDEVDIHLTAHRVPHLLEQAVQAADTPYCLGGRCYDLAVDHSDRHGQTWHYLGHRQEDETPLLTLHGSDGPHYPFPAVITSNGPLTPTA